jgi:tRNA pseudouridine55 synthase
MARRRKGRPLHGWLIVDKAEGMTSTAVVGRVKSLLEAQKAGHGGTLDPLASGVLPIALGEATKTIPYMQDAAKRYRFTLRWGEARSTDDAEGAVIAQSDLRPTREAIEGALGAFEGEIQQVPPRYSAIKVEGRRAYDRARAEEEFELTPRPVVIEQISLTAQDDPDHATFEVTCGKGAYMRSLSRDLGTRLGGHAHIVALRRLAVGPFTEARAISLESLEALGHSARACERLLPVEAALDGIPALAITELEASHLRSGRRVSLVARARREQVRGLGNGTILWAKWGERPVALARYEGGEMCPIRVFNL